MKSLNNLKAVILQFWSVKSRLFSTHLSERSYKLYGTCILDNLSSSFKSSTPSTLL